MVTYVREVSWAGGGGVGWGDWANITLIILCRLASVISNQLTIPHCFGTTVNLSHLARFLLSASSVAYRQRNNNIRNMHGERERGYGVEVITSFDAKRCILLHSTTPITA